MDKIKIEITSVLRDRIADEVDESLAVFVGWDAGDTFSKEHTFAEKFHLLLEPELSQAIDDRHNVHLVSFHVLAPTSCSPEYGVVQREGSALFSAFRGLTDPTEHAVVINVVGS